VDQTSPENPSSDEQPDEGPGWMPAILAGTVLMGILGFITCAFSTWVLFQNRTELAIRTCDTYVTTLEQSLLEPQTKSVVIDQIKSLAADMKRGKYEDWQSAGIMQRLQRLPVAQWGDLQAVQAVLAKSSDENRADQLKQLTRLQRAVELGKVTSFDFEDILAPVREADPNSPTGYRLIQPLQTDQLAEVALRAKLSADRSEVPDQVFDNVQIETIVRREIEQGASQGTY
jgi:hypothetical protein